MDSDDHDDPTKNDLKERIETLEAENQRLRDELDSGTSLARRGAIQAGGLLAGGSLLSLLFGTAAAAPSGTIPAPSDPPFTKFRGDHIRLVPRTSDVSSPTDGTVTYREDL